VGAQVEDGHPAPGQVALDGLLQGEAAVVAGEGDRTGEGREGAHAAGETLVEAPGHGKVRPGLTRPARLSTAAPMHPERRPLIAGNWKMNAGGPDAGPLAAGVDAAARGAARVDVLVAPPFTALAPVAQVLDELGSAVRVAAQNMSAEASGA